MTPVQPRPPLLLVGNFLSATLGARGVSEDLAVELSQAGWPVITVSTKLNRLARVWDMAQTVWRRRHDYALAHVEVYSGAAFCWAELICGLLQGLRKPFVLTLHGGNLPNFARRWPGRVRRLLHAAQAVTTPSRYLNEQMRPYRGDLQLLPNALHLARYPYRRRTHPAPKLIWVRAFHRIYNPALAPQIIALLAPEFPDIQLQMLGSDKGDGSLQQTQQAARDWQVADRIHFPGAVPKAELPRWLLQADIFLNTTQVDNTPVSVLEALASGLCIVSTNVGGLPYLLRHEQDALLAPPNDAAALAAAVRRVLTEDGLAGQLSQTARHQASQWDWQAVLPRWEELLSRRSAVGGGRLVEPAPLPASSNPE
jgi:glycosyltransferase involved in cell wall biosynthesis